MAFIFFCPGQGSSVIAQSSIKSLTVFMHKFACLLLPVYIRRVFACAQFEPVGGRVGFVAQEANFIMIVADGGKVFEFYCPHSHAFVVLLLSSGNVFGIFFDGFVHTVELGTELFYASFGGDERVSTAEFAGADEKFQLALEVVELVKVEGGVAFGHLADDLLVHSLFVVKLLPQFVVFRLRDFLLVSEPLDFLLFRLQPALQLLAYGIFRVEAVGLDVFGTVHHDDKLVCRVAEGFAQHVAVADLVALLLHTRQAKRTAFGVKLKHAVFVASHGIAPFQAERGAGQARAVNGGAVGSLAATGFDISRLHLCEACRDDGQEADQECESFHDV